MRKPKSRPEGKWVFVPTKELTPAQQEEYEEQRKNEVVQGLAMLRHLSGNPFAALEEFRNYFPGDNQVPEGGAWVLVKESPHTEFTVPPLSIWFAEPWPMQHERHCSHRVKIVTPRGDLGLFPREYSLITDPQKYYEFLGEGMEIKFFGNEEGVPKDKLFYLRSRGISKKDALAMLIGEIKSHGIMWIETQKEVAMTFCRSWPDASRLATL